MKITICDDDRNTVSLIKKCLSQYFQEKKIACPPIEVFSSGDALLMNTTKKDIVFLDIEMPGINGISVSKKLLASNKDTIIIIITSYSEYLDDAMRLNIFRYISKPLDLKRLSRNINDAIRTYILKQERAVTIETAKEISRFNTSDIIMLEMNERKVIVYTTSDKLITEKSLKEWREKLPPSLFYQCHRSFIINISHIKKISTDKVYMDQKNLEAYLTKRKHAEIKKRWLLYIESIS